MKNFNSFFNQLTAMPKRLAMVLTVLFTLGVGSMWGAEVESYSATFTSLTNHSYTQNKTFTLNGKSWTASVSQVASSVFYLGCNSNNASKGILANNSTFAEIVTALKSVDAKYSSTSNAHAYALLFDNAYDNVTKVNFAWSGGNNAFQVYLFGYTNSAWVSLSSTNYATSGTNTAGSVEWKGDATNYTKFAVVARPGATNSTVSNKTLRASTFKIYTDNSAGTPETPEKTATSLEWSAATYTATIDGANTFPTLTTTPANLTGVTYSSSNTAAATINASTGAITLVAAGTTTITASYAGNETYEAAENATYKLTVESAQGGGSGSGECTWELVTDASTLKVDDEVIIAASDNNYAISTNQANNNRTATAITKDGNTLTAPGNAVQILTLKTGTKSGTWAFYTGASGYLYAASSSGNQLKTKTTLDVHGSWTISIENKIASIVAKGSSNRNVMQFNPNNGSPIFACYASASQTALALYKKVCKSSTPTYTITWKNEDGTTLKTESLEYGATPSYDGTPTKEQDAQYTYTFKGWTPTIATVIGNQTYTATYTSTIRQYAVTFDNNGHGDKPTNQNVYYNGNATNPGNLSATGYIFNGWYDNSGNLFDFENTKITGPITITAKWCEILGDATGLSVQTDYVENGLTYVKFSWTPTDNTKSHASKQVICIGKVGEEKKCTDLEKNQVWTADLRSKLSPGEYEWTIQAIGDGETYCDGEVISGPNFTIEEPLTDNCRWIETEIGEIEPEDEVVVTMTNGATTWALDQRLSDWDYPLATIVSVIGSEIQSSEIFDEIKWNISGNAIDGYILYPSGNNDKWLYCGKSTVKIGNTNTDNVFSIVNGFFFHVNTTDYWNRYLAVASTAQTPDWRTYEGTQAIIAAKSQTLKFYKKTCLDDTEVWVNCNITNATHNAPTSISKDAESLEITLVAADECSLPETITVKIGENALEHTWDASTGTLTINKPNGGFSGDITITVTALPKLATPTELNATDVTHNSATLTWTWNESTNQSYLNSYNVYIYSADGSEKLVGPVTATTKSLSTSKISGLTLSAETTYTFKVTAITRNSEVCLNSNQSEAGTFTTNAIPTYTITWSAAGEETTTTVNQGDAVVLPDTPTSCSGEYTTFVGWFTAAAAIETNPSAEPQGTQVTASTIPTGNTTYYAVWADGSGSGDYQLVTDINNLQAGDIITFANIKDNNTEGKVIAAFASGNYWPVVDVTTTESGSILSSTEGLQSFTLQIGTTQDSWSFYDGTGYPYAANTTSGNNNYMKHETEKSLKSSFTISIDNSTSEATIVSKATDVNGRTYLQYNYNNGTASRFSCYTGGQTNPYIYKLTSAATGYISSCCQSQAVVTVAPTETELALNIDGTASTNVHISQEGAGNGKYNQPTISPAEGASLNWTGNYKQVPYDLTFTATKAGTYTITADFTETEAACPRYGTATINVVANPILVVSEPTISSQCGTASVPVAVTIDSRYLTGAKLTAQVATTAGNGTFEICKTQDGTFATTNLTEIAAGHADKTTATIYVRYVAGVDENTAATGTLTISDGTTSQTVDLSTTPTCGTSIRMTATDANSLRVTTANGQWTRTQTAIHLRGAYLLQGLQSGQGAKVVLSSSNSNFKFVKPDVQSAGTATFESDKIITETWEQDIHLVYTPTTYNANERTTITAQVITFGGNTEHASSTMEAYGRSFPETFVLALNTGDGWVALPADMIAPYGTSCNTGVGTHDPYPITVDDEANPTAATLAPARAVYKGAARNTPMTNPWTIQLESNELTGYYLFGSNNANTTISNSNQATGEGIKWALSTSDNITYQLSQTTVTEGQKLGYNGTNKVMGQYLDNSYKYDFRILPVENTCTYHIEPVMEFMGFAANDNPQVKIKYDGTTTYLISTDNKSTWSEITGVQDCKDLIFNLDHNTFGNKNIWLKPAGDLCVETVSSTPLLVPAPVIIEWYANTRLVHRQVAAAGTDITMPEDEIEPCEGKVFVGWTTTADLQDAADAPDDLFEELTTTLSEDAKYYAVFATEVAGDTQEVEATLSFANTINRTSQTSEQQVWEQNGITLTNNKANSTSDVADYANPARFYKGSTIGIEVSGKISQIVFDCDDNEYASNLKTSIGSSATYSSTTVTAKLDGTSASFSTALSAQVRLNSLTVTYTAEGGPSYTNYSTTCGTYTITYYGFTGGYSTTCDDNPAVVEIPIGATFTIVDCTPTADPKNLGREFAGTWNTATDGTGTPYKPGDDFIPTSDITLYAQWTLDMTDDLTIPAGIEDLANTDITVTGGKTLILPEGTTTINSLNLRGGLENGTYAMPNVYVPANATLVRNNETIYLDLVVNAANYYPVAVPFATPAIKDNIDYLDPTLRNASTYKTHYVFKTYDGAARAQNGEDRANNWVVVDENSTLQPGVGYIVKALTYPTKDTATIRIPMIVSNDWFADGELTQVGETSRNAIAVTAHTGAASQATNGNRHAGWNFVASPYLSKFAGNNIDSEGNLDYINGAIHINGEFAEGGEEVPYVTVPAYDFSYYMSHKLSEVVLNPEWSFFVQIGSDGTMNFTTEGRQQAPAALRASAAAANPHIEANLAIFRNEKKADHTGLIIDDRYTSDYEIGADLEKMFGSAYNTTIYTISQSTRLAYNALPHNIAQQSIPLGFRAAEEGEYTISLTNYEEIVGAESIILHDLYTGLKTNLLHLDYTFDTEATQDDNRFVVYIVARDNTATDISTTVGDTLDKQNRKVLINNHLYIIHEGRMYNGAGQIVK